MYEKINDAAAILCLCIILTVVFLLTYTKVTGGTIRIPIEVPIIIENPLDLEDELLHYFLYMEDEVLLLDGYQLILT